MRERAEDDQQEILLNLENQIQELKDHGMDLIIEEEVTMQNLNLTLQKQQHNILERLFIEDDDYVDWIKCATVEEDVMMQQILGKNTEPKVHLYPVYDDLIKGGNMWTQIKNKTRLDESSNEKQQKKLWDLVEKFQEVFALHKGELGNVL